MSLLKNVYTGQKEMVATFAWNFSDTMVGTTGLTYSLGTDTANDVIGAAKTFDVINLPPGAVVTGGFIAVSTAFDTAGYDVIVGDSVTADRYMLATDVKGLSTTALLSPGFVTTGLPIRVSIQSDDVCTTGVARLVLRYILTDRVEEVIAHP